MAKRVNIVCDCCGDTTTTIEFIERIARSFNVPTDLIHEALYEDKPVRGLPRLVLEGCHAERLGGD